jgi:tubulin delta
LNYAIGSALAGALLPSQESRGSLLNSSSDVSDLIRHLCPTSGHKLISLKTVPQMPPSSVEYTNDSWQGGVVKRLRQMHACGAELESDLNWRLMKDLNVSVANLLILRGSSGGGAGFNAPSGRSPPPSSSSSLKKADQQQQQASVNTNVWNVDCSAFEPTSTPYAPWNPTPLLIKRSPSNFQKYDKMGTLLSNNQGALNILQRVSRAQEKFEVGAYVHQYEAFGVGASEFEEAFDKLEQVACNYRALSASAGEDAVGD